MSICGITMTESLSFSQLKEVRSVIIAGALDYDFLSQLRSLETCFITSCKDLRSQVVREACISAAYVLLIYSLVLSLAFPSATHYPICEAR